MQKNYLNSITKLFIISVLAPAISLATTPRPKCEFSNLPTLTVKNIEGCKQKDLDALYLSLPTGPSVPDGFWNGTVQIAKKEKKSFLSKLNIFKWLFPSLLFEIEETILEQLWKGKDFQAYRSDSGILFNKIFRSVKAFPAHVYYGDSLFDSSRDSIIIDYAHNYEIPGYRHSTDWMVNKYGLSVRDEIRFINKNLYLGRAYIKGKFLLNFTLQKK